jgi:hypothetical protein
VLKYVILGAILKIGIRARCLIDFGIKTHSEIFIHNYNFQKKVTSEFCERLINKEGL